MRSILQQLVVMNHVLGFSATTSKKQGAKRIVTIQHEDDWTMDDILKPKTNSNRSRYVEKKCVSVCYYRTNKEQDKKNCINNNKKKPKGSSVRFNMDRNEVTYRHVTDEDLENSWISRTEYRAIKESIYSTLTTINELVKKNKNETTGGCCCTKKMIPPTSTNIIDYIQSKYGGYDNHHDICLRGLEFHVSPTLGLWKKENRIKIRQSVLVSTKKPRSVVLDCSSSTDKLQNALEEPYQQNVVNESSKQENDVVTVVVTQAFSKSLLSQKDEMHALQKAMMDAVEAQFIHSKYFPRIDDADDRVTKTKKYI